MENLKDLKREHPVWCRMASILFLVGAWIGAYLFYLATPGDSLEIQLDGCSNAELFAYGTFFVLVVLSILIYATNVTNFYSWLFGVSALFNYSIAAAIWLVKFFNWTALGLNDYVSYDHCCASLWVANLSLIFMILVLLRRNSPQSEEYDGQYAGHFEKVCFFWETIFWIASISALILFQINMEELSWIYLLIAAIFLLHTVTLSFVSSRFSFNLFGISFFIVCIIEILQSEGIISIPPLVEECSIVGIVVKEPSITAVIAWIAGVLGLWHYFGED